MSLTSTPGSPPTLHTNPPAVWKVLHGVTLRPPVVAWRGQTYTGARLAGLDDRQASQVTGVVGVVRRQNFVGVVASQIQQAQRACSLLDARWLGPADVEQANVQSESACLLETEASNKHASDTSNKTGTFAHTYHWQAPTALQANSVNPSSNAANASIASFDGATLSIWAALPRVVLDALRAELACLCQLAPTAIFFYSTHPATPATVEICDAAVDAALLSWHVKRPVRVAASAHISTHSPDAWRVTCSAQTTQATTRQTPIFHTRIQNADAPRRPSLAALLCGLQALCAPQKTTLTLCADTRHETLDFHTSEAAVAAQVFARESFLDEYWRSQGQDPLQARLHALIDDTGRALIEAVREQSGWGVDASQPLPAGRGRGFAYAHVVDNPQADNPRTSPAHVRSAWVAEVQVQPDSGQLELLRVTVGHDVDHGVDHDVDHTTEQAESPQALEQAIQETALHCLPAPHSWDSWGNPDFSIMLSNTRTDVQIVRCGIRPNPGNVNSDHDTPSTTLAWHRGVELPVTAAIANAIAQATGIRLRQAPLDTQALQNQLGSRSTPPRPIWKRPALWLGGLASAVGGLMLALSPWRGAIAPLAELDTSLYSEQAIARGQLVAIAGDCMVCHTAKGGEVNAGGLALDTPFGTIYSTNITPDRATGIGTWSFAAFERAMRQGIHQNGQRLYPAFPYTAFAKISDADMQALYAWLMTREPVSKLSPETRLSFPYNLRFAMTGWNALFHDATPYTPDPEQSRLWNRGAYLVQGAGHCGACHTPRNVLGAEKTGEHFLSGGLADGWEAPALNQLSKAPIPWTENSLYDYLRTGYSPLHGVAAGPMAPVVHGLAQLPDEDVRAMAHYLASLTAPGTNQSGNGTNASNTNGVMNTTGLSSELLTDAQQAARLEQRSRELDNVMLLPAERLFDGACAVCHDTRDGPPLFGTRPSLALNTNLHSDLPDNVIQVLLHGIPEPALPNLGYMPGFKDSLNDEQLTNLLTYMRQRFAPDKPAWKNLPEKIRALRQGAEH